MPDLSSIEQTYLLKFARDQIHQALKLPTQPLPDVLCSKYKRGCFVTLKLGGELRGCIGTFNTECLLLENLKNMAYAAAFKDPRFPPLTAGEAGQTKIEISVLGSLQPLKNNQELKIGTHGIMVKSGLCRGTYLPEVALEQGWTSDEFIRHCALQKAGLTEAEFEQAEIFIYRVTKISESCPG